MLQGKSIARQGFEITTKDGQVIGRVCSGTLSPSLEKAIGTGFVQSKDAVIGGTCFVKIRGELCEAEIVKPPFLIKQTHSIKAI